MAWLGVMSSMARRGEIFFMAMARPGVMFAMARLGVIIYMAFIAQNLFINEFLESNPHNEIVNLLFTFTI